MVASARAMFAAFFVWLAEPARSFAPHLDGAHCSSRGLSETGPFNVCATARAANASRSTVRTALPIIECLIEISSARTVEGPGDVRPWRDTNRKAHRKPARPPASGLPYRDRPASNRAPLPPLLPGVRDLPDHARARPGEERRRHRVVDVELSVVHHVHAFTVVREHDVVGPLEAPPVLGLLVGVRPGLLVP